MGHHLTPIQPNSQRNEGLVRNRAVYLAIGVRCSGHKGGRGLWTEQIKGAKLWLRVMHGFKVRGLSDILTAVVDGPKAFPRQSRPCFQKPSPRPTSST